MDARELLSIIEARGGVARLKGEGAETKINVAPRSLAMELLPDLQRLKPQLIELLRESKQSSALEDASKVHSGELTKPPFEGYDDLSPAAHAALKALADARSGRRFDFKDGERIFSPTGRFVSLSPELRRLWKEAEAAVGRPLSVWGRPLMPCPTLPEKVNTCTFGEVWNRTQRLPDWGRLTEPQRWELVTRLTIIEQGLDPRKFPDLFPPTTDS